MEIKDEGAAAQGQLIGKKEINAHAYLINQEHRLGPVSSGAKR